MITQIKYYYMGKSRRRKYEQFLSLINPTRDSTILDVGVADKEYSRFDNYLEREYPYSDKITALSIYPLNEFKKRYPFVQAVTFQGGRFPFKDREFSVVYSNAVIEHVGGFQEQVDFVREISRCGNSFYFTTPAKEAPIETHTNFPFIHWLPKKRLDQALKFFGKGWAAGNYMNLLGRRDVVNCLKRANVMEYKIFVHRFGPFPLHYAVVGRGRM